MTAKASKKRFEWAAAERGWRGKNGKIIPFEEMTDKQLEKHLKQAQHKELSYLNKSYIFADKIQEIESEAEKREIVLNGLDTEYHRNNKVLKS